MTFPNTQIAVTVEILVNAAWTDITSDVRVSDTIIIVRGRGDEVGTASPSQCTLMLNNRQGKYSPRNPLGTYYGQLTMNTQLRVTVDGSNRRFWGEVAEWPPRWDMSTRNAYVPITANGILRRLGQGSKTLSGYKQYLLSTSPVTYWPLDDGSESDRGWPAAGTYQGSSIHREVGTAVFEFGVGTLGPHLAQTLRINDTKPASGEDRMIGYCRGSDPFLDGCAMDLVWRVDTEVIPTGGMTSSATGSFHIHLYLNGVTISHDWDIRFRHDGTNDDIQLSVTTNTSSGTTTTVLGDSAVLPEVQDTELHHLRLSLVEDGSDIDYTVYVDGVSVLSGTHAGFAVQRPDAVTIEYDRASNTTDALINIGHVIVWENVANIPDLTTTSGLAHGFVGEAAGRRFERLCGELDIPFVSNGDLDDTLAMGLQFEDDLMTQFTEIEGTDRGIIYEPRTSLALGYRTRVSLYSQTAALTLSQSSKQVAAPLEPTDDDQYLRNALTVTRREGASYEATKMTGPLSTLDPPNGAGPYRDEVTVNVETDDDVAPVAGWLLSLGTVDEPRYPQIVVERAAPAIVANGSLSTAVMTADVGDRLVVNSTDALNIYDDISQIIAGYTEVIAPKSHRFTFNCVPESPYQVLELDDANSRVDPGEDSTLAEDLTTNETGADTASSGFLWTTSAGDMSISAMVGGEEVTITAISGASSPQTFTETRSVNGVVKTQPTGAVVRLKRPGVIAL